MVLSLAVFSVSSSEAQGPVYHPVERQIAAAESPLPLNLQKGARVLGYNNQGKLITLRPGSNDMICVADDPAGKQFHVACYHKSLEPFMARGRELHAMKKSKEAVDSTRLRDIRTRRYSMPSKPAALFQYFAPRDSVDAGTGAVRAAQYLYVVYTPYATHASTGISETPVEGGPWIMNPGKPWAHLMIAPQKTASVTMR
jgi:hypothetical protein